MEYKRIITQWLEFEVPPLKKRDIEAVPNNDFITTIIGPRRAGKTYLCFQMMRELLKTEPKSGFLYINFEDNRLLNATADSLDTLIETWYELSGYSQDQPQYLFLDEIQNVANWDLWLRKTFDLHKNIRLIVTGSSSKLLSREISTKLGGRTINKEVFPLSFKEYLNWKEVAYSFNTVSTGRQAPVIRRHFSEYLRNGGYPAVIGMGKSAEQVLQSYFESMIFKDIVERYSVSDIKKLKALAGLLFESAAKDISYTKLDNKLRSLGYGGSKNTIIDYIGHMEDAYLFFQNIKYEYSLTKRMGAIKKIYAVDNGLLNAVSYSHSENTGKLMESVVYLELKRRRKNVFFYRNDCECDFIISEKGRITEAIQVTQSLTEETELREVKGLTEAMDVYGLKKGLILTENQEMIINNSCGLITVMPAWKWLLI